MKEVWYDEEVDILNIQVCEKGYWKSIELSNDIVVDIGKDGSIIAIEILHASKWFAGDARKVIDGARVVSS